MNNQSPIDASSYGSKFQWSLPNTSTEKNKWTSIESHSSLKDISVKEILDKYNYDSELLKYILSAKAEEDKRSTAEDVLKTQEVRIQLKQIDLDIIREQTKVHARYEEPLFRVQDIPFYKLAPVQQQVLTRFNYPQQLAPQNQYSLPPSPATLYPHSAHPLCPLSNSNPPHIYPVAIPPIPRHRTAQEDKKNLKRSRYSISNDTTDKKSHNKVLEALKAKIRRGSTSIESPLKEKATASSSLTAIRHKHPITPLSPSSLSPPSAKPNLPFIEKQACEKNSDRYNNKDDNSEPLSDNGISSAISALTPVSQESKSLRKSC